MAARLQLGQDKAGSLELLPGLSMLASSSCLPRCVSKELDQKWGGSHRGCCHGRRWLYQLLGHYASFQILFDRQEENERDYLPFVGLLPKYVQLGLDQPEGRGEKSSLGLPQGQWGYNYLSCYAMPPKVCINKSSSE